jgi:hypothetical protein
VLPQGRIAHFVFSTFSPRLNGKGIEIAHLSIEKSSANGYNADDRRPAVLISFDLPAKEN